MISRKRLLIVRCCVIQCIAHVRSVTWLDSFAVWEDAEELAAEHDAPVEADGGGEGEGGGEGTSRRRSV